MKKLFIFIILCMWSLSSWALNTKDDVNRVYKRLIKSNRLSKSIPIIVEDCKDEKGNTVSNAMNDGKAIIICTAFLRGFHNEEELAWVIGHELAHSKWSTEQRADEYGALYARAAGYNYCKGAKILKGFGNGDMPVHPPGKDRLASMRCK